MNASALPISPYLTTAEAAAYLRFRTAAGVRTAVMRGELHPHGAGPNGCHLFRVDELDQFVEARLVRRVLSKRRHATPGKKGERDAHHGHEDEVRGGPDDGQQQVLSPGENRRPENGPEEGGSALRVEMIRAFSTGPVVGRVRIRDFARSWIASKARLVDSHTIDGYRSALEEHILPELGGLHYDSLRPADVQAWVNRSLAKTWTKHSAKGKKKVYRYSVTSAHSWFRVLRNITRDAVHQLDLPRDPTTRITFADRHERDGGNAITGEKLGRFLDAIKSKYPRNYALAATLAFTGLRFCHTSALKWEDIDKDNGVIRIKRKQRSGIVGPVSRRKRAPRELALIPELAAILEEHRRRFTVQPARGVDAGWIFLSEVGTLRTSGSLVKAWLACAKEAGVEGRFTVHGLRRTFNDLARRAGVDAVVTKAITGHVTEDMREHYSSVDLSEKRTAMTSVLRLVPRPSDGQVGEGPQMAEVG